MKRAHIQKLWRSLVCFPAFILGLAALSARAAEWPMFQLDARHSANNTEDSIRFPLENLWQVESGADSFGFSSAIQANNAVYTAFSNGKLSAFDKLTGTQLCSIKVDGAVHSAPLYRNGIVYFATSDGKIYALNASDGKVAWAYAAGTAINTSPVVQDDLLFSASNNGMLYALKTDTGELAWKTDLGNDYIRSSPAADQSRVYTATLNGDVFALDKLSGGLLWKTNLQSRIGSAPSVDGLSVFVASHDGKIRALRTQDGALIWTYDLGTPANMALAISSGAVHAVSRAGQIYALAKSNGLLLWKFKMDAASYSAPTIIGDKLLVGANDKNLYALTVSGGALVSKTPLAAKVFSPIALSRGKAAFLGDTGGLYLFKSPNQPPLSASDLKVNGKSNPPLNSSAPIFTWLFRDNDPDDKQVSFVLQIADENLNFSAPVFDSDIALSTNAIFTLDRLLPEGKYFWRVKCSDLFEDEGGFTSGDDFFIWDRTAPEIIVSSPVAGVFVAAKDRIVVFFAAADNLDPAPAVSAFLIQSEDRGSPRGSRPASVAVADGQAIEPLDIDDGLWRLTVSATDFADNTSSLSGGAFEVIHDVLPPVTELTVSGARYAGGGNTYIRKDTELKLKSIDDLVAAGDGVGWGVKKQAVKLKAEGLIVKELTFENPTPGQGRIFVSTFTLDREADGIYSLSYNAEDVMGNTEKINISAFIVDNTPPVASFNISGPLYTKDGARYITPASGLAFTATDPAVNGVSAGVERIEVSVDGGVYVKYASELNFSEGRHTIKYRAYDNVGNLEAEHALEVQSDNTAPVSKWLAAGGSWIEKDSKFYFNASGSIALESADPMINEVTSGLEGIYYGIDTAPVIRYASAFILNEGIRTLNYRAKDNVGNTEVVKSTVIYADGTAPASALSLSGDHYKGDRQYVSLRTAIIITAEDPAVNEVAVGIKETKYAVDGGAFSNYSLFKLSAEGRHLVSFYSADYVNNVETVKTAGVWVDATPPATALTISGARYSPPGDDTIYLTKDSGIVLTSTDPVSNETASGVLITKYRVDAGNWQVYAGSFTITAEGRHTLEYYSLDRVMNTEVLKTAKIAVDNTPPVTAITLGEPKFEVFGLPLLTPETPVTLSALDPVSNDVVSGLNSIYYEMEDAHTGIRAAVTAYLEPFRLAQGAFIIRYWSKDNVANAETPKALRVSVMTWRQDGLAAVSGLDMSGTSDITGAVKSNAVVSVSGNARILGDVTASTITVTGKALITGQKVSGAAPVHPEPVYMADIIQRSAVINDNALIDRQYLTDGRLVLASKSNIILSTGIYYFTGLEAAGGSTITVAGKVDILVDGGIKISGGSSVNAGGAASNLNIFVSTISTVDFTGGADFLACLYAPYSHMKLAGNAVLGGHYFAKTSAVSGTANFIQSGESLPQVVIVTADSGGKKKVSALGAETAGAKVLVGPDPAFKLGEVYVFPNPAKGGAVPAFHIETGIADSVKIIVYTVSGREAHEHTLTGMPAALDDGNGLSYAYEYAWRGHIPSGVYYYFIEAGKAGQKLKKTGRFAVLR